MYAKNGIKIGKTTVTESDFTKTRNGVKGVMDKWVEPPKIKKMRVDDSGKLVNDEDDDNTLLADTVKVPNQIVTRTGVLVVTQIQKMLVVLLLLKLVLLQKLK